MLEKAPMSHRTVEWTALTRLSTDAISATIMTMKRRHGANVLPFPCSQRKIAFPRARRLPGGAEAHQFFLSWEARHGQKVVRRQSDLRRDRQHFGTALRGARHRAVGAGHHGPGPWPVQRIWLRRNG